MWFTKRNETKNFKSFNVILYLVFFCLIIIFLSKPASAETNSLNEIGQLKKGTGETLLSSSIKYGQKSRGKRSVKKKSVRSKRYKFPQVAVFQADGVFWPYDVEKDVEGPFALKRKDVLAKQMEEYDIKVPMQVEIVNDHKSEHEIMDNKGQLIKAYDGIKDVLEAIKNKRTKLALAQTTNVGATVLHLIQLCGFDVFKFKEVDDDPEIDQIKRLQTRAEVEFKDMAYFGTNETFIKEIQKLGVIAIKINVGEGLKMHHIEEAEKLYATQKQ